MKFISLLGVKVIKTMKFSLKTRKNLQNEGFFSK